MVLRHFSGTGLGYLNNELPWEDWWPLLVVALEAEERERRAAFMGKEAEYEPFFAPGEADITQSSQAAVVDKIIGFATGGKADVGRLWLDQMAQWKPNLVKAVFQREDGVFVDENGDPVPATEGYAFIPETDGVDAPHQPNVLDILLRGKQE